MGSDRNIFIAFLLNFLFSVAELIGGIITGSIAIVSDALHDFGDATAIAVSAFLERKSKRPPDKRYTYGYGRFSVMGGAINAIILLIGSIVVVIGAIGRLICPSPANYDGMIILAIIGVIINSAAAYATHGGHSLNEKTVSLHMIEDVLGWAVVLLGAIVMRFTNWWFIDPLMSIGVAVWILIHAGKSLGTAVVILLEKSPISAAQLHDAIMAVDGVEDVRHIHIWSLDDYTVLATMHIVTSGSDHTVKESVRERCHHLGIQHVTLEMERTGADCRENHCNIRSHGHGSCHHHHH